MNFDAIVVPGGGLNAAGELLEHARRRFDLALERAAGEPFVALSAGTTHRPANLDPHGRLRSEALAGAHYLIARGVSPERIYCESTSYDTIGNAYFSRVQIVEPMGWRRLLIVTSKFHMPRAEAIFRWIYSLDATPPYQLEFAASPDVGLSEAALAARQAKEAASLQSVQRHATRLKSLREVTRWLFTEHKAYQAERDPLSRASSELLESY